MSLNINILRDPRIKDVSVNKCGQQFHYNRIETQDQVRLKKQYLESSNLWNFP